MELALRRREEVLAEVTQRMQEMGVRASAEELTDLLATAARRGRPSELRLLRGYDLRRLHLLDRRRAEPAL